MGRMVQANPKRYDLLGGVSGHIDDDWSMNQHRDIVSIGDTVYFFMSTGFVVRRDGRNAWRQRIVVGATAYGLRLLAAPAPTLVDYLHTR